MSAPVSPKSSFHALGGLGLVPTQLAGMLPGFSTPPIGGPSALPSPGFSLYTDFGNHSNVAHRRSGSRPDIRHGIPTSLHVTVNGPDSQWDIVTENRQMPQNYPPRHNGVYVSRNSQSSDQDQDRPLQRTVDEQIPKVLRRRPLQRMVDEQISKVLLRRSPHQTSKYNRQELTAGSRRHGHE